MLRERAASTGRVPPALLEKPILDDYEVDLWDAYMALSGSRRLGFGAAGPIPMSEILAYCEMFGIRDVDERELLVAVIQGCDGEYFEHQKRVKGSR